MLARNGVNSVYIDAGAPYALHKTLPSSRPSAASAGTQLSRHTPV